MSLADELLLDLDGDSDGALSDSDQQQQQPEAGPSTSKSTTSNGSKGGGLMLPPSTLPSKRKVLEDSLDDANTGGDDEDDEMNGRGEEEGGGLMAIPEGGVRPAEELDKDAIEQMSLGGVDDVNKVAKLLGAKRLEVVLRVSLSSTGYK
jgi:U4/U6 small nuclear ribonucleoprotein PRP31